MSMSLMPTLLLALVLAIAAFDRPATDLAHQATAQRDRYFKEDHLTGADYLWLRADGNYTITSREHVGLFEGERGQWTQRDASLTLTPSHRLAEGAFKPGGKAYGATEVAHGTRRFLAFTAHHAASLPIPVAETLEALKRSPDSVPLYVFFEIDQRTFDEETRRTYPFRTRQPK
jgi:hypothetical protein